MSRYKTCDYIKFDTPEQREQIVRKLEGEGYCVHNTFEPDRYKLLRFSTFYRKWFYDGIWIEDNIHNCNITDKFWDEYEAEQDLTICLEGVYCPRYYKVEFTLEDYLKFFKDNPDFDEPSYSIHSTNGTVTLVIDVKTGCTHIPSLWESSGLQSCIEISTESVTSLSEEIRHVTGLKGGLVAKAKDVENYNKWLDAVKFNRSQEFKVLTKGFEESLEIIDSLYK